MLFKIIFLESNMINKSGKDKMPAKLEASIISRLKIRYDNLL